MELGLLSLVNKQFFHNLLRSHAKWIIVKCPQTILPHFLISALHFWHAPNVPNIPIITTPAYI
jgi:hypothetical protein